MDKHNDKINQNNTAFKSGKAFLKICAVAVTTLALCAGSIFGGAGFPNAPVIPVQAAAQEVGGLSFTVSEDTVTNYTPTQIVNGSFKDYPLIEFIYNGHTYKKSELPYGANTGRTASGKPTGGTQVQFIYNGVDQGWNTTEQLINSFGFPFDYCNISNQAGAAAGAGCNVTNHYNQALDNNDFYRQYAKCGNDYSYIEMNYFKQSIFWQDLSTSGGDVIRWTLDHACRCQNTAHETIHVEIGAPKIKDGQLVAPVGYGTNVPKIANIEADSLAKFEYNGITSNEGGYGSCNLSELAGLSLNANSQYNRWYTSAGVYTIPEGQNVTRFAFISDSSSAGGEADGNLLDDITFNTLIGNLRGSVTIDDENVVVAVAGYWGETDPAKTFVVRIDETDYPIDMSGVVANANKNFKITTTIPRSTLGTNNTIKVFHEDYEVATKEVVLEHTHDWTYKKSGNAIKAYCSSVHDVDFCKYNGENNAIEISLNAQSAGYTGKDYSAISINGVGRFNTLTGHNVQTADIKYYDSNGTELSGAPRNYGTYTAKLTVEGQTISSQFIIKLESKYSDAGLPDNTVIDTSTTPRTIKLMEDAELVDTLLLDESFILDLNGHTITGPKGKPAIMVSGKTVNLLIKDSVGGGTIESPKNETPSGNGYSAIDFSTANNGSVLTIDNGVTILGGDGGDGTETSPNGGTGGPAIAGKNGITVTINEGGTVIGGNGGDGYPGEDGTDGTPGKGGKGVTAPVPGGDGTKTDGTDGEVLDPSKQQNGGHTHKWDIKMSDKIMTIKCIGEGSPKCVNYVEEVQVELVVDDTKGVNDKYVSLKVTGDNDAKKRIPKRTLTYEGIDGTTYGPSATAPKTAGTYKVTLECDGRTIMAKFTITVNGSIADVKEIYCYRYPGKGINRANGFIDYTPREDIKNFAYDGDTNKQVDDIYINMTKETLVSAFRYECYTIDGGKKWIKGKLDNEKLAKAFNKRTNIRLAEKYDEKTKKPAEGAKQYFFNTINKRAQATTLKPNYQLYMDPYGITTGQWTLLKVTTEVNLYQYYEIGIAEGKKLGKQGFGIWPDAGGVWVPDLAKGGKAQKVLYFYRTRATVDTPASKVKKVKISSVLAPTKLKADYKKEILKMKKGISLFFGESIPNLYEVPYDFENSVYLGTEATLADFEGKYLKAATDEQAKGINIVNYLTGTRNTIHLWVNATSGKPATAVQQLVLAARGVISAEKKLKCEKGKVVLEKGKDISYEFYDETTQKWAEKIPAVTGSTTLRCRVKCNAKGGKENGRNYATGIEATCEITWGVIDSKSEKEGIISAVIKPAE